MGFEYNEESQRVVHEANGQIYEALRSQMIRYNEDLATIGKSENALLIPPAWEDLDVQMRVVFGLVTNKQQDQMSMILSNIAATLIANNN